MDKMNLKSRLQYDMNNFFSTQEDRDSIEYKVTMVPVNLLDGFPEHPFHVKQNEDMDKLIASIELKGIIEPILVRYAPYGGGRYQIISGHRRVYACKCLGLTDIPAIVKELDDDTATILMVDANLRRENVTPIEKAKAFKMRMEAFKRYRLHTAEAADDNTASEIRNEIYGRSDEAIAADTGMSARQVQRFIRLNNLIPDIQDMVEEDAIKLNPAVEISFLSAASQEKLFRTMDELQCTPSHAQTIRLKEMEKEKKLTKEQITQVLKELKPNQIEKLSIPIDQISAYFPDDIDPAEMVQIVINALKKYSASE